MKLSAPIRDALTRAGYTVLATGGALLIADSAAKGVTHISMADYKAAGVAALAGILSLIKTTALNYLANHQSLKAEVAALTAQVASLTPPQA